MSHAPMSAFDAVFNGHINNAHRRAYAMMRKECPTYLAKVKARARLGGGIMAIFSAPTPYPRAYWRYAALVQRFVNETADDNAAS